MEKHMVSEANAADIWDWLNTRGGLAIWRSVNLSNPGASWTTPVNDSKGNKVSKPSWQAESTPSRIIVDPAEVEVVTAKELKRFRVGIRQSGNGLSLKVTDGGTRRINKAINSAMEKFGNAWYEFDYMTQEAVIMVPAVVVPITEWADSNLKGKPDEICSRDK